ncbi:MAG: Ppx/GppA family phosphatase [Candidatus Omnitrophica bacterium]|nr:Ppx/GppA family phosphatase [Candidatus Omnitrophota bacterium]
MKSVRRAVIDVGTNSVKLLVATVTGQSVLPLWEESEQTRLGRGLRQSQRLQPESIAQTARAVARFAAIAARYDARSVRVVATSAARDAINQDELRSSIRQAANLDVRILSGEEEAEWAFRGVSTDPRLARRRLVVLDAGGGSTQLITGDSAGHRTRFSLALGAVHLLEHLQPGNPPRKGELTRCRAWLRDYFALHLPPPSSILSGGPPGAGEQLVGTGGTSSLMAAIHLGLNTFDRQRIEEVCLTRAQIQQLLESLWRMSLADRKQIPGLPPERADVILTGVAIHAAIVEHLGMADLIVSTRGLRFAALLE